METKPPVVFARWRGFGGGGVSLGRWSASCSVGGAEAERSIIEPTSEMSSRVSGIVVRTVPAPRRLPVGLSTRGGRVLWTMGKAWTVVCSADGLRFAEKYSSVVCFLVPSVRGDGVRSGLTGTGGSALLR